MRNKQEMKTNKKILSSLIAFVVVCSLITLAAAQQDPYVLNGYVKDKTGSGLVGANITFNNTNTNEQIYYNTCTNGAYSQNALNFPSKYTNGDNITYYVVYNGTDYLNETYYHVINTTAGGGHNANIILDQAPTIPTSPTNLDMNLIDHTPTITWTKGTDADGGDTVTTYVYVGTVTSPTTEEGHNTGTTIDLGSTITLTDGTTYYYRLRSYDGERWSTYTADDQFRMNSLPTTSSVDIQGAQEIQHITDHTPDITWSYNDGESDTQTKYNTTVWTGTGGTGTLMGTSGDVTNAGTTWTYSGSGLTDGTTYYARVKTYDGYEWSAWSETTFRMNSEPTVSSVVIDQATVYTNTAITGSGSYADPESDGESGTTYKWFKNDAEIGGQTTTSLASSNFKRADTIIFQYTPNDGYEAGTAVNSSAKTISNSLPTVPTTLGLTTTIYVGSTLTATGSGSTDADTGDGDTLIYHYEFKEGANELQAYSTDDTYVILVGNAHDTVTVNTKVHDGVTYSSVKTNTKVVSDTEPTTPSGSSIAAGTKYVGSTLTVTGAGTTDADNDAVTYQYQFRRGSVSGTIVQALSDTNTYVIQTADAHDTIYVLVYGRAYSVNSGAYEAENRAVTNSVPVLASIGAKGANDNVEITVDADATDGDSDTRTYSCNRTDLFSDFSTSTGLGHWTPFYNQTGVYYVDFGVNDGYGGTDNETVTVTVTDVTFNTGLFSGYNLLAWIGETNGSANAFADIVPSATYIIQKNETTGAYDSFDPGIPEVNNFTTITGKGYYAYTTATSPFSRSRIDAVTYNTTLTLKYSIFGWTNITTWSASTIANDIGGNCVYIIQKNETTGMYEAFDPIVPEVNNFNVKTGIGYYTYLTSETIWTRKS